MNHYCSDDHCCMSQKNIIRFSLERYEYAPGETLDLINLSSKKRRQIWEIINPDGPGVR